MVISKSVTKILLTISFLCHLFSLIQYKIYQNDINVPEYWTTSIIIFLTLSFIFSFILVFSKNEWLILILFFLKLTLIYLIGYPMGLNVYIEMTLLISLVIEIMLYLPLIYGIIVATGSVLFIVVIQKPVIIWGKEIPAPEFSDLSLLIIYPVLFIFVTATLKVYAVLNDENKDSLERLNKAIKQITDANMGFQNYAFSVEKDSADKERKRITREIHDIVGYTLTNQSMMLEASIILIDKDIMQLKKLIYHARDQVKEGMEDVRSTLHELRSVEKHKSIGTKSVIRLAKTFEEITGVKTEVNLTNMPYSPGIKIESILIRILQEGMTNALKHGSANIIKIVLWQDKDKISISIHDNGTGSTTVKEGIGFKGIEERLKPFGGSITAANTIDGFRLLVTIPFPKETVNEK